MVKIDWDTFKSSIFFVLGFSVVFSLVGVLLQTVLTSVGYSVQTWLARIGGVIIIIFGLYIMGLIKIKFLERDYSVSVKRKFKSSYLTSFVFGAAFAVGWSPCVSAALGAVLALSATSPSSAFILLMAYTLGLGIPFLILGMFASRASKLIQKATKWFKYIQAFFGALLVIIGVLIFVSQLSRIANLEFVANLFGSSAISVGGSSVMSLSLLNLGIAFFAGIVSFLSPCVLPLLPGFLAYLTSVSVKQNE
ncbi:cytochrome C biogenesis protein [Candidatus Woesearchaeota archaeon]|nr:cytochrome C biogenesis protein [Candidatus Woesearchaeota archaeon]